MSLQKLGGGAHQDNILTLLSTAPKVKTFNKKDQRAMLSPLL